MKIPLLVSIIYLLQRVSAEKTVQNDGNDNMVAINKEMAMQLSHNAAHTNRNQTRRLLRTARGAKAAPHSVFLITWGGGSLRCAKAATSVTISCGTGGTIALTGKKMGVSTCTTPSKNTVKCTKQASFAFASVGVQCTGVYSAVAAMPRYTYTKCNRVLAGVSAKQFVNMAQFCSIFSFKFNTTGVLQTYSRKCATSSQLKVIAGVPRCKSQSSTCVGGSTCSVTTSAVSVSSSPSDVQCTVV